ncbi:MAG: hypothetical protein ACQESF_02500 [Nanobdellota archaeon]
MITNPDLEKLVKREFSLVKISKYALEKSNYIAKRVSELYSEPIEVMFYLTNDKNNSEDVITDAHINFDQYLKHTYCFPTPAGKRKTIEEVEKQNKKVIGHGHSHADMSVFYSPDDHAMFKKLSNQLGNYKTITQKEESKENIIYEPEKKQLIIDNGLTKKIIKADVFEYIPKRVTTNTVKKLNITATKIKRLYGMTFNQRNDTPYTCLGIRYNGNYSFHKITHEVVPTDKRLTSVDKEEIDRQLKERVDILAEKYNKNKGKKDDNSRPDKDSLENMTKQAATNYEKKDSLEKSPEKYAKLNKDYSDIKEKYETSLEILSELPLYARKKKEAEKLVTLKSNINEIYNFIDKYKPIEDSDSNARLLLVKSRNNLNIIYDNVFRNAKLYRKRSKSINKRINKRKLEHSEKLELETLKDAYDIILRNGWDINEYS